MLKKSVTFDNIDGVKVTEEFHFFVDQSDLIDLLVEKPEMEEKLQMLATNMDGRAIMSLLKEFMLLSVGRRDPEGRKFIKSKEIAEDFRYSGAYNSLYWELINDPAKANDFLEGIIPTSLLQDVEKMKNSGSLEDVRKQLQEGKSIEEINLPDKDWAAKPVADHPLAQKTEELPSSGVIDTVEGQVVTVDKRTPFPGSLPEAISAQGETQSSEQPAWLKERREPTHKEFLEMDKKEMSLAFRMKQAGELNTEDKQAG